MTYNEWLESLKVGDKVVERNHIAPCFPVVVLEVGRKSLWVGREGEEGKREYSKRSGRSRGQGVIGSHWLVTVQEAFGK